MSEAGKEQILSETNQLPTSFEEMDLSKEVLRAIKDMGFTTPSTVQAKTIPLMMSGADVNAIAPTGTGKTCAFGIPMLEYVQLNEPEVQEVVLAPTRELALQIGDELTKLAKYIKGCRIAVLYGGQPIPKQLAALKRCADRQESITRDVVALQDRDGQQHKHSRDEGQRDTDGQQRVGRLGVLGAIIPGCLQEQP